MTDTIWEGERIIERRQERITLDSVYNGSWYEITRHKKEDDRWTEDQYIQLSGEQMESLYNHFSNMKPHQAYVADQLAGQFHRATKELGMGTVNVNVVRVLERLIELGVL